jgi:hypothetical protein
MNTGSHAWLARAKVAARLILVLLPCILGGCYVGAVGIVAGILALTDNGGGGGPAAPVRVRDMIVQAPSTPDEIHVELTLAGGRGGRLSARIEFRVLSWTSIDKQADGISHPATPLGQDSALDGIDPGKPVGFVWDARRDLEDESAEVLLVVTPAEAGADGESASRTLRAGNTPVTVQNVRLASQRERVEVIFDILDKEGDRASLVDVLGVGGGGEFGIPPAILDRRDFATSRTGERSSFGFKVTELDQVELSKPGFVGDITIRFFSSDYPCEAPTGAEGTFPFDNNDPPRLAVFPIPPEQWTSGIIPIHYTLEDEERNPATVAVTVDLGDGLGPRRASEFPSRLSDGTEDIQVTEEPRLFTFLWDALSQARGNENVTIAVLASDLEDGPQNVQTISLGFPALSRAGEIPAGRNPRAVIADDFDRDGFQDLLAANETSSTVTHMKGGEAGLAWSSEIRTGTGPAALAKGDFDGDGNLDAVTANSVGSSLTFLRGLGSQGFERVEPDIPAAQNPGPAMGSDLTRDGIDDLVVLHDLLLSRGKLSFSSGTGGGLSSPRTIDVGRNPAAFVLGDFKTDGFVDVVVANKGSDDLSFIEGTVDGPAPAAAVVPGAGDGPVALASGFFEGPQGPLGLVVAGENSGTLQYYRASPAGLVREERTIRLAEGLSAILAADFTGDLFFDVAVLDAESGEIQYLEGGPGGLSSDGSTFPAGTHPRALAAADFDGDGFHDLAVVNEGSANVTYFQGVTGGLQRKLELPAGDGPTAGTSGDFNGDGLADLAVANGLSGNVTYFEARAGGLAHVREMQVGSGPVAITSGDHDGDGFLDLAVANAGSDNVTYLRGGLAGPRRWGEIPTDGNPLFLASGHFNGDRYLDLAVANRSATVSYLSGGERGLTLEEIDIPIATLNSGAREPEAITSGRYRFREADPGFSDVAVGVPLYVSYLTGGGEGLNPPSNEIRITEGVLEFPSALETADFDGDGYMDVAISSKSHHRISLLRGGPRGLEVAPERISVGKFPIALRATDFDGDGLADLVAAGRDSSEVHFLKGSPGGLMGDPSPDPTGDRPVALEAADFDGDGLTDAAAANEASGSVTWLRGTASGLERARDIPAGPLPRALAARDFDGDGFPDLLVASSTRGLHSLRGGPRGPRPGGTLPTGEGPTAIASGDFDRDGFADLAVVNNLSSSVSYYRQNVLVPHPSAWADPGKPEDWPVTLLDPRSPPRYRLELPRGSLRAPAQICLVPAEVFRLPPSPGARFAVVTEAVTVLRESLELDAQAWLTLRLRGGDAALLEEVLQVADTEPRKLQVFRDDPAMGAAERVEAQGFEIVDFASGKGVAFPIRRFGTYVVGLERSRL